MSVSAAPNRCAISAHVVTAREDDAGTYRLRLTIDQVRPLQGGTFVEVGDEIDAWVSGTHPETVPGDRIGAEAEYVGGPFRGALHLYDVTVTR